jgi:hypothetical protein
MGGQRVLVITLKPQHTPFNGEILYALEGKISELKISETMENLLEQIQAYSKAKAGFSGVAAGLLGMENIVATASQVMFYDGEDTYNFAALLNGKAVVCGTFKGAATFENGEKVRFVLSNRADVLYAHAAYRMGPKVLMVPGSTYNGDKAHFAACMRTARNITVGLWFMFGVFFGWKAITDSRGLSPDGKALLIVLCSLLPPVIGFAMEYWTYKSTRDWGLHASAIFKALGIPRPDDFSLQGHLSPNRTNVPYGYLFEEALEAHLKRYPEIAKAH